MLLGVPDSACRDAPVWDGVAAASLGYLSRVHLQDFNHGLFDPKAVHLPVGNAASPSSLRRGVTWTFLISHHKGLCSSPLGWAPRPCPEHAVPFYTSTMLLLGLIFTSFLYRVKYFKVCVHHLFQNPSISLRVFPLLLCPYGAWLA